MSGGSYDYLFCREVNELFSVDALDNMESIEVHLLSTGYDDIAKDVRRLIEYIKSADNRISVLHEQLGGVFKAVEWYDSGDYSKGTMKKELEKYRTGAKETETCTK